MTGGQVVSGRFKDVKIFIRSNQDEQDEELRDLSVLGILSVLVV